MNINYKNIDEYIALQSEDVIESLEQIRQTIRNIVPDAEETINYGIPTFKLHGNLVHFAAFKKHIGFYPGANGVETFKNELTNYKTSKGTIQFQLDEEIPYDLIIKITEFRVKENLEKQKKMITVKTSINASVEKVWEFWTNPEHIVNWNFASDDWHCPRASNNLKVGEKFNATMAAKDGSMSFDFEGEYTEIIDYKLIKYKLKDNRKIEVNFEVTNEGTLITESFDPENVNPEELQRNGWQAILNNFKKYIESD